MYIYYIIAAVVIVNSMAVLKAYSKPKQVMVRAKAMSHTEIEGLIERLEDIIADLDSARD